MGNKFTMLCMAALIIGCANYGSQLIDVKTYIEKRSNCEHFLGEVSGEPDKNPAREKEVNTAVEKYCTGVDTELANLKIQHINDAEILKKLNEYEISIEK